jgi:hypothetical protein
MQRNHLLNLSRILTLNIVLKTGFAVFLVAILMQGTTGCNPGKSPASQVPSYTASHTKTATISLTYSPTRNHPSTSTVSNTSTPDFTHTIVSRVTLRFDFNNNYDFSAEDKLRTYLDLDSMESGDTPQSDLHFYATFGSSEWIWLEAINGATTRSRGPNKITLQDCYKEPDLATPVKSDVYVGNYLCAVSNKNRIFVIFIENLIKKPTYDSIILLITTYV